MVITILIVLVLLVGPLSLGLAGVRRASRERRESAARAVPWDWRPTFRSALLYTLAFNLTFFIQELFLVLPKALTPGLRPTLFHNNHTWEGSDPLAGLFQGTGALATVVSGAVCMLLLQRRSSRSTTPRLFLVWMAYSGFFMALPQVVIGAVSPRSDLGMAMEFLRLGPMAKTAAALLALALIPAAAWRLTREFLRTAANPAQLASAGARTRYIFHVATLPALIAIPMIIPFRIPRGLIEVVAVPVVVSVVGMLWVQAGAWCRGAVSPQGRAQGSLAYPLAGAVILLVAFQLLLRRGIAFF